MATSSMKLPESITPLACPECATDRNRLKMVKMHDGRLEAAAEIEITCANGHNWGIWIEQTDGKLTIGSQL